ncbi:hypothetical protein QR680_009069 [Steinernema hermaphroditum]|uniref:Actin-related protein 2/3 complex subunit 5 n=1 Tax=Steinernema hermaphroditum TaxID=289476 RepID=A0AA39IKC6_9BILA|nr:hypothetical protein QR680_009069 [Steinernema hermaphroditum]
MFSTSRLFPPSTSIGTSEMAKNMESTSYRKIDVDAYDPDKFEDTEDVETPGIGPDERQVTQLLSSNQNIEALHAALLNPPLKSKNQAVKDRATALVTRVLTSFKTNEIEGAVQKLDDDEADLLMKYVYKAMDILADGANCQYLLVWHAQIIQRSGLGAVMRVLSDRRRV